MKIINMNNNYITTNIINSKRTKILKILINNT